MTVPQVRHETPQIAFPGLRCSVPGCILTRQNCGEHRAENRIAGIWSEPSLLCGSCGATLPAPKPTGRPRRWCNAACRQAGRRAGLAARGSWR